MQECRQVDHSLLIVTDLDGCLLNKADYAYYAARPALDRLAASKIPLVLCSSKTQAEMRPLAEELGVPWPLVCENGGVIVWRDQRPDTILGVPRSNILSAIQESRQEFRFRSFSDLGVEGLMSVADLPREKAIHALNRQCTEPLLWEDTDTNLEVFRSLMAKHDLALTRGGRFWHVAGDVSKGDGMRKVVDWFAVWEAEPFTTVAIGDSPIDLPMLELADIAVVIPQPDGTRLISPNHPRCIHATHAGPVGWSATVCGLLDEFV